jgi:hypothetical protein
MYMPFHDPFIPNGSPVLQWTTSSLDEVHLSLARSVGDPKFLIS